MSLQVLIVEDSEDDAELMLRELERAGYDVVAKRVETAESMEAALGEADWDVVLSDYSLPQFDGLAALGLARRLVTDVPFILVSGTVGEDVAVEAMRAGAHDYILKDSLTRLAPAVKREVCEAEVRREHRESERARHESERKLASIFQSAMDGILLSDAETGRLLDGNNAICRMLGYTEQELLQLSIPNIHPQEEVAGVWDELQRQRTGEASLAVDIPMRRKDGSVFYADVNSTVIRLHGQECMLGVFRDITLRRTSEQKIRRLLEQQTHINELALELGDLSKIENIYESVFRHVKSLMDAQAFIVSFYNQETRTLTAEYALLDGRPFDVSKLPPIPLELKERGTQSEVVHTGEPLYLPDFRKAREKGTTEYTVDDGGETVAEGPPPEGSDQITRSALLAPLKVEGRTLGVMQVQSHHLDGYTQEDIDLLTGLASVTAVAVSNSRLVQEIRESLDSTIRVVARTVEIRDPYTSGHQRRVTELACAIAEGLGLPRDVREGLRVAGLLHDIGKIAVPAEVLSKPTRLSDAEFSLIRTHPQVGHDLLAGVKFSGPVMQIVLQHHERMDGSGYPQGLQGNGILMEARILAVADVVEAMASHRPYRPGLGMEAARAELRKGQGELYDSDVVRVCLRVLEDGFQFSSSDENWLV